MILLNRLDANFVDTISSNYKIILHAITHFWTTAKNKNVQICRDTVTDEMLLEYKYDVS